MLCLPGVASPTEAFAALAAGAGRTNVTHRTQANIQADKQAHMHMHGAGCADGLCVLSICCHTRLWTGRQTAGRWIGRQACTQARRQPLRQTETDTHTHADMTRCHLALPWHTELKR